ncbi:MAG TPA: cytochrome c3 family protein, partial [Steroidobacteraceae bacterium]
MLGGIRRALLLVVLVSCLPAGQRAVAINPETLLMPGKLANAHQKYEEQCSQCHDRSDSSRQTRLCLDCHKEIAADINTKTHLHGKMPGIGASQCHACHTEHLGRNGDIVKLNPG